MGDNEWWRKTDIQQQNKAREGGKVEEAQEDQQNDGKSIRYHSQSVFKWQNHLGRNWKDLAKNFYFSTWTKTRIFQRIRWKKLVMLTKTSTIFSNFGLRKIIANLAGTTTFHSFEFRWSNVAWWITIRKKSNINFSQSSWQSSWGSIKASFKVRKYWWCSWWAWRMCQ